MINKDALNYNAQVRAQLSNICVPLFSASCIKSFRYFRVFEGGLYLNLSTHHEWLCDRVLNIPNNGKSFHKPLCSATEEKLTFFLWEHNIKDGIFNLFLKYNIANGISAYRRKGDSVEAWSFGANLEDSQASNFYINNLHLLEEFISYFNINASEFIDASNKLKLASFSEKVSISQADLKDESVSFANSSSSRRNEESHLSTREIECLKLLSMGKTFKETAKALNISPRTVESYITNIKLKLNRESKSQIIDFFWENLA